MSKNTIRAGNGGAGGMAAIGDTRLAGNGSGGGTGGDGGDGGDAEGGGAYYGALVGSGITNNTVTAGPGGNGGTPGGTPGNPGDANGPNFWPPLI